jgi:muconolactone D-isomerase
MEFLVEFDVEVPDGTSETEVEQRTRAEAVAAAGLAAEGHLLRLWRSTTAAADSRAELDALLRALPLADWMHMTVVPLAPHPNDPGRDAR